MNQRSRNHTTPQQTQAPSAIVAQSFQLYKLDLTKWNETFYFLRHMLIVKTFVITIWLENRKPTCKDKKKEISLFDSLVGVAKYCSTYFIDNNTLGWTIEILCFIIALHHSCNLIYRIEWKTMRMLFIRIMACCVQL